MLLCCWFVHSDWGNFVCVGLIIQPSTFQSKPTFIGACGFIVKISNPLASGLFTIVHDTKIHARHPTLLSLLPTLKHRKAQKWC